MSKRNKHTGCILCGQRIVYSTHASTYTCSMCAGVFKANAVCESGHFVCDSCHMSAGQSIIAMLLGSKEKDPVRLFLSAVEKGGTHLHGPEHHSIVPCVLLTVYRNNGGIIDLRAALETATGRGAKMPGGMCGFMGACGAAIGVGIYASIVTGSTPLNAEVWSLPLLLTARCLEAIATVGGPRCCKRTSRIAIQTAAQFTREKLGVNMPARDYPCTYHAENRECIGMRCPYYGVNGDA